MAEFFRWDQKNVRSDTPLFSYIKDKREKHKYVYVHYTSLVTSIDISTVIILQNFIQILQPKAISVWK